MFHVDTNGTCLLCQNDCNIPYRPEDPADSLHLSASNSFQMLLRYLKVSTIEMPEFGNLLHEIDDVHETRVQFLITLCSRCASVTTEFHEWFNYFENVRLQLDRCCHVLRDLIQRGRKEESGGRQQDEIMPNSTIAEKLRKETLEKCSQRIQSSLPKIVIKKDELTTKQVMAIPQSSFPTDSEPHNQPDPDNLTFGPEEEISEGAPFTRKSRSTRHIRTVRAGTTTSCSQEFSEETSLEESTPFPKSTRFREGHFECNECGITLSRKDNLKRHVDTLHLKLKTKCEHCSTPVRPSDLNHHLISKHPLQKFSDKLPPNTREEDFDAALNQVLSRKKKVMGLGGVDEKPYVKCCICQERRSNAESIRVHMLLAHFDIILQQLNGEIENREEEDDDYRKQNGKRNRR